MAVPVAGLKPGDKVLATNTHTGKTKAEPVTAVLVHHDTNRYNLTIKVGKQAAVIHTTRNHLFWDLTRGRWVKAGALKYGDHLRTPGGHKTVTAIGGWTPRGHDGWMWDLTITGDHDFYLSTDDTAVLVHNCAAFAGRDPAFRANLENEIGPPPHRQRAQSMFRVVGSEEAITGAAPQ